MNTIPTKFEDLFGFLVNHQLFKEKLHNQFEEAEIENNTKLFEEVLNDIEKLKFCIAFTKCTVLKWKNWDNYLIKLKIKN